MDLKRGPGKRKGFVGCLDSCADYSICRQSVITCRRCSLPSGEVIHQLRRQSMGMGAKDSRTAKGLMKPTNEACLSKDLKRCGRSSHQRQRT
jgi:hypothetical protein